MNMNLDYNFNDIVYENDTCRTINRHSNETEHSSGAISQTHHVCKSCNEPLEMCAAQSCEIYSHRCDPLFALSPFSSDDDSRTCQGFGSVLQYQNCDVIGGSCDQMFTVQNMQVCEYCRSADGRCRIGCEKPSLYFARRRPPFASEEGYGKNGYRIENKSSIDTLTNKLPFEKENSGLSIAPLGRQRSWKIPALFS